ncbi:ABC transporter substrate-binding protein [Facklamia miroungae]|uniref:Iron complex transport system substrate-binding protein n=1 Tax=Facklamia miroungae TaxID=120956 RepID=A0A1G7R0S1_9LACT|nr:ABC transporter substrate-binding protein [Facklamia miroungae]NKZ29138.1 ABC transporter substrate-binding protein [Facklamia miroungae]SDG04378.1 iron complex transport system substrate-binding protein [Facklamia miroungae]
MKKNITLVMMVVLTLFTGHVASAEEMTGLKLTDMVGREVVLEDGPAEEIVTLMPADAEILFKLGAGDTIVGRGTYVDYPADDVEDIPAIATGETLNIEEIIALDPQVVVMSTMSLTEDQIAGIEEAGIPVLVTDAKTIEGVYDAIDLLGQVVGKEKEAKQLIEEMEAVFKEYEEKAADHDDSSSVYYEVSPLEFGLWTAGSETFMDEIGHMLNLENIFADQQSFVEVSEEQVLLADPQVIITTSMPIDEKAPSPEEEIMQRAEWKGLSAVKEEKVFAVDNSAFTRPGPRLMDAVRELYELVYGQE